MIDFFQDILSDFFIFGLVPDTIETWGYNYYFVALSYVIAVFGSYIALKLVGDLSDTDKALRINILEKGAAISLGAGIWSMHFIGMLAYDMTMVHDYDAVLTGVSMVIAIIFAYGVIR